LGLSTDHSDYVLQYVGRNPCCGPVAALLFPLSGAEHALFLSRQVKHRRRDWTCQGRMGLFSGRHEVRVGVTGENSRK
jgi:hypothetical protein